VFLLENTGPHPPAPASGGEKCENITGFACHEGFYW
jgi:hypothetical protein